MVLPALAINYMGQGALLMRDPSAIENPFFRLFPQHLLIPAVVLATIATVIASQAVISGAFSVTRQAMQLGFVPRMEVQHTSEKEAGQIYLPAVNWGLMLAVMILVLGFRSSNNLAAAYGIAVTLTMVITTAMAFFVARDTWGIPHVFGKSDADAVFGVVGEDGVHLEREPAEHEAGTRAQVRVQHRRAVAVIERQRRQRAIAGRERAGVPGASDHANGRTLVDDVRCNDRKRIAVAALVGTRRI